MLVELRSLDSIKPYDKNPRRNDAAVDAVVRSIEEYGWRQPLPDKARQRVLVPDLLAAGIAPQDQRGVIDYHSFRYAFVTRLVRSAVPIKAAMTLARHSDPKLTLNTYARLSLADERAALEQACGRRPAPAIPATGTHG